MSTLRRLEPATTNPMHSYPSKASSTPHPYQRSFIKPLLCRTPFDLSKCSKAFVLPKLKIFSEILENEARASTNPEIVLDASSLINKVTGKTNHVNGGANVVTRKIIINGATNEQIMDKHTKVLSQANSTVSVEEAGYQDSIETWTTSIMRDANNVSTYVKFMQALYQPPKEGLGIVDFLRGKNLFITGATGFLAKVLVEKILRVQPDVGQLFLLIQGKDTHHVKKRLQDEVIQSVLFNNIKSRCGDSYQQFMDKKLTPIMGNIAANNLGMDISTMEALQRKLDIVVNSAASTTFDERYDHALNLNTRGAQRIVEFGRSCLHLQLLMHVSTAFVNGERKGVVKEKKFTVGHSIANEALDQKEGMAPDINVEKESNAIQKRIQEILNHGQSTGSVQALQSNEKQREKQLQEAMKELGMERAKSYGWQDTYVFTKAMGEMLVDSTRGQLPVVIVRPSVVESTFKDPFPGWMEGNRMMDPIIISYGRGQLPGFLVDPKSVLDVVPVDMVANAMLAAMAKHAGTPGLEVYQVASSVVNPLVFSELAKMSSDHFKEHPFIDGDGNPLRLSNLQIFQDMESFMNAVTKCSHSIKERIRSSANADALVARHKQLTLKIKQQAAYLANLYQPYTFYAGRFDNAKTQHLHSSLSQQEKEIFGFDVREIDWESYIKRTHIPGLRKHVLKGRGSSTSS